MNRRRVAMVGTLVLALALVVLAQAGCGGGSTTTTAAPATTAAPETAATSAVPTTTTLGPPTKLTLFLPLPVKTIAMFPAVVADALGYFKDENLTVDIQTADSSPFIISQMSSGKGDAGLILAGTAISAFAQGQDFKAVWEMITHPVFSVVVPENSAVKSLADLKGKQIGIEDATSGYLPELKASLKAAGVDVDKGDALLVPLGQDYGPVLQKLDSGAISAQVASYNHVVTLIEQTYKFRDVYPQPAAGQEHPQVPLVVRGDLYKSSPQAVIGLARAMTKAVVFAKANPDAALAIMKKVFPPEHSDPNAARLYMERAIYMSWPATEGTPFGTMSIKGAQELVDQMVNPGQPSGLEKSFDVSPFFTNDLITEINNFDQAKVEAEAKASTLTYP
ncbi:MAG: ABC transporter substrate-binding protein [Actinobacteria bacterium]|nr:ABC transporter substrate-binding protein [Actinomycetota bacterium]